MCGIKKVHLIFFSFSLNLRMKKFLCLLFLLMLLSFASPNVNITQLSIRHLIEYTSTKRRKRYGGLHEKIGMLVKEYYLGVRVCRINLSAGY